MVLVKLGVTLVISNGAVMVVLVASDVVTLVALWFPFSTTLTTTSGMFATITIVRVTRTFSSLALTTMLRPTAPFNVNVKNGTRSPAVSENNL